MRYIAYYRVSTKHQGLSGLGLEAQKGIAHSFLKTNDELVAEFVEVESGKQNNRPELNKAIELSKQESATLLIAVLTISYSMKAALANPAQTLRNNE